MKYIYLILIMLVSVNFSYTQDLITGDDFLAQASQHFKSIMDYRATIEIRDSRTGDLKLQGSLIYKRPNLLRIDFSGGQVFVSNGEKILFYTPTYSFILKQNLEENPENKDVAETVKGLDYLENTYSAAFVDTPEMVALDEGSSEMVYKLNLFSSFARFREIEVAINSNLMIRRIITNLITVDYKNIQINTNIVNQQFDYTPPSSATVVQDFLY